MSLDMSSITDKRKSPDHNLKERERRSYIKAKFQDLKFVLGLRPSVSKVNILKEAQMECSALKNMSDNLVSLFTGCKFS